MTRPATHIFRLLKWGRTLARHGALRGIERDPNTPPQVRRLARIARLGTIQPREPDYAGALSDIGPANAGQAITLMPLFGAVIAAVTLGERLHPFHFAGMAFILTGIALSLLAIRRQQPAGATKGRSLEDRR